LDLDLLEHQLGGKTNHYHRSVHALKERLANDFRRHGIAPYSAVVVHGGPGAPGSLFSLAERVSQQVGTVEPFQFATTVSSQVVELNRQIAEYAEAPVWLFGHSWGAWLSCFYASEYPQNVRKLFLIGSGPFEERYVSDITKRRMDRLHDVEQLEFQKLISALEMESDHGKDGLLKKLGELTSKSDNYAVDDFPGDTGKTIEVNAAQYQSVWREAARLRSSGALLKTVASLSMPIVVIHGREDPHPARGVIEPLRGKGGEVRTYLLDRCGHYPWKERHAKKRFWEIIARELNCV
jgi:pimeloyl-ACP methyl ester carboxylesterase